MFSYATVKLYYAYLLLLALLPALGQWYWGGRWALKAFGIAVPIEVFLTVFGFAGLDAWSRTPAGQVDGADALGFAFLFYLVMVPACVLVLAPFGAQVVYGFRADLRK
jgi:hypothetical protein